MNTQFATVNSKFGMAPFGIADLTSLFPRRAARVQGLEPEGFRRSRPLDASEHREMVDVFTMAKAGGMPFDAGSMSRYTPLAAVDFAQSLYEFRTKDKSSPLMQLADLCLYPVCRGGYEPTYRAYRAMAEAGRLIDAVVPPGELAARGIKYSCFDGGV